MQKLVSLVLFAGLSLNSFAAQPKTFEAELREFYPAERRADLEALAEDLAAQACIVDSIEAGELNARALAACNRSTRWGVGTLSVLGTILSFVPAAVAWSMGSDATLWFIAGGSVPAAGSLYLGDKTVNATYAEDDRMNKERQRNLDTIIKQVHAFEERLAMSLYPALRMLRELPPDLLASLRAHSSHPEFYDGKIERGTRAKLSKDVMQLSTILRQLTAWISSGPGQIWTKAPNLRERLREWQAKIEPHLMVIAAAVMARTRLIFIAGAATPNDQSDLMLANLGVGICGERIGNYGSALGWFLHAPVGSMPEAVLADEAAGKTAHD